MSVQERIRMCRIINQMEDLPELSKRLGLENKSTLHGKYIDEKQERKRGNEK